MSSTRLPSRNVGSTRQKQTQMCKNVILINVAFYTILSTSIKGCPYKTLNDQSNMIIALNIKNITADFYGSIRFRRLLERLNKYLISN